ncbi:MAG: hypothetical protein NT166_26425 [Candidatus Aminicenantes bacterium]|nr:hypothetical protein [Candidatus Aminicenantes bacterium]
MLEDSKIEGGEIMITLADRLRKEGIEIGEKIGIEIGEKRGEKKGKLKTARTLIKKGINMEIIAEATGFPKKRLEKLAETVH